MHLSVKLRTIYSEFNSQNHAHARTHTQNLTKLKKLLCIIIVYGIVLYNNILYSYILYVVQIPFPQHSISHF